MRKEELKLLRKLSKKDIYSLDPHEKDLLVVLSCKSLAETYLSKAIEDGTPQDPENPPVVNG